MLRAEEKSMAIPRQIEVLVAELAAIELWDTVYKSVAMHDLMDQTAFETRQARRQQIQHDIQILLESSREGAGGHADPDGPASKTTVSGGADARYQLPKASITVLRGRMVK
jgi:hypothetical protein